MQETDEVVLVLALPASIIIISAQEIVHCLVHIKVLSHKSWREVCERRGKGEGGVCENG